MIQERTLNLIAMKVVGNALADQAVWIEADKIVSDELAPMADRLVALAKMNELTGIDNPCSPESLEEYFSI